MVEPLRPGPPAEGAALEVRPWPLWAVFVAALALALPAIWAYDRLEPGPDGGGVPDNVLAPLFWLASLAGVAALAWLANRRIRNGLRLLAAVGVAGVGYAVGLVGIVVAGLATSDCNGPTMADWREPGLRSQYTATSDYEDDYHSVRFRDDGAVDVRWSDGPLRLRMRVDAGDGVVVTGNIDGLSESVLRAAIEAHFAQHGLPAPAFEQFSFGQALC